MNAITLSSAAFAGLLSDVLTAAGKDGTLPALCGVNLYTAQDERGETLLVGNASDRYVAIQGHVRLDSGGLDQPLWLTREQIGQILTVTRPYRIGRRADQGQIQVEIADGVCTVKQLGLDTLASIEARFKVSSIDPPDLVKAFTASRERETVSEVFAVNGEKLARLARLSNDGDRLMTIRCTGASKPVEIGIGRHLVAILMPVRLGNEQALPVPLYDVPVMDQKVAA